MDGNNPKVSFIPKGSLVHEDSFLERRRPQSVISYLAGIIFILSVSTYFGLFYYNNLLNTQVAEKTIEIENAQREFSNAPEVEEAKVFRARADLARELLNAHTVASPVFMFLSKNTVDSILYEKFSFNDGPNGSTLELFGEAPTYATLAYQADVFRGKTKELSRFSVTDITLTKFNTITFALTMTFAPNYLLYTKNLNNLTSTVLQNETPEPVVVPTITTAVKTPTPPVVSAPTSPSSEELATSTPAVAQALSALDTGISPLSNDWTMAPRATTTTSTSTKVVAKESILRSLWSKFKFW